MTLIHQLLDPDLEHLKRVAVLLHLLLVGLVPGLEDQAQNVIREAVHVQADPAHSLQRVHNDRVRVRQDLAQGHNVHDLVQLHRTALVAQRAHNDLEALMVRSVLVALPDLIGLEALQIHNVQEVLRVHNDQQVQQDPNNRLVQRGRTVL